MPKRNIKDYPDTPLKEQVRDYEDTQSVWDVILKEVFNIDREKDDVKGN